MKLAAHAAQRRPATFLSSPFLSLPGAFRAAPREGDRAATAALLQRSAKNVVMKRCGGMCLVGVCGNGRGKKTFFSAPSCLLPTMPRVWPPPGWCRARDGSPGPRPAPEEPPGSPQPSVAEREAPVPQLERASPPPPDLPSPRTSATSAQHSSSSNPDTQTAAALLSLLRTPQAAVALTQPELYHPQLNPYGLQQCARCGLVARPQHLQFRSGSWLCGFILPLQTWRPNCRLWAWTMSGARASRTASKHSQLSKRGHHKTKAATLLSLPHMLRSEDRRRSLARRSLACRFGCGTTCSATLLSSP